jgi:hypothetical protein
MDRRLLRNQNGKRKCVVVVRKRDGAKGPHPASSGGKKVKVLVRGFEQPRPCQ